MPMVRPCGDFAHTSYGVFIPIPLGKTAAKNIGLSMQVLGELGINGGRMTAFVDPGPFCPSLGTTKRRGSFVFILAAFTSRDAPL